MRKLPAALVALALTLALAGCGAKKQPETTQAQEPLPWDQEANSAFIVQQDPIPASKQMEGKTGVIRMIMTDSGFAPAVVPAKEGHVVRIYVKNGGSKPHNLVVSQFNVFTSNLEPGQDNYIEFTPNAKGEWPMISDAPAGNGQAEPGFKAILKVE